MTATDDLVCRDATRRQLIRERGLNGVDFVDVTGRHLCVHFLTGIPEGLTPANVVIRGGRRITDLVVEHLDADQADDEFEESCLGIQLDREGDWSTYTLCFVETDEFGRPTDRPLASLDPRYACVDVKFRIDCPAEIDCKVVDACAPPALPPPSINYLTKDYATFRQLLLDRLSLLMPDWRERHVPDLGIALVEVLAYVGDYLSYYQDAVATEQYLDTARRRISVRRHARLVDYAMHEGCNARTFLDLRVGADVELDPRDLYFVTGSENAPLPFEAMTPLRLRTAHNTIAIHTWGDQECCLPKGATRATLVDDGLDLRAGDFLLFEELACAGTAFNSVKPGDGGFDGVAAMPDVDRTHRHVVRLTKVTGGVDALLDQRIVEVEWSREDALPFMLCISAIGTAPQCDFVRGMAVARGNVVLVDHGLTISDEALPVVPEQAAVDVCEGEDVLAEIVRTPRRYRPALRYAPLTHAQPMSATASATPLLRQNPRLALPAISLSSVAPRVHGQEPRDTWIARADLFDSGSDDTAFVAEVDDEGRAHLRFGNGEHARALEVGTMFAATYRVGNGRAGIVGAESIVRAVFRSGTSDAITLVRNPLPSVGAVEPEPLAEVKLYAPSVFRGDLQRAVTAHDYGTLAQLLRYPERNPRVQSAAANLRWSGSWYEANVGVDAAGATELDPQVRTSISGSLHRYRRMGHDLRVGAAQLVPLRLELELCVKRDYLRAHVSAAVADAIRAFFHPDNLTFGEAVYVSRIVAAVMAVDGVAEVHVTRLERLGRRKLGNPDLKKGLLELGPREIAQLDDDPAVPENGILRIREVRGGR